MAKNFNQIYESVYTTGNSMSFGNAMLRGNGIPLDITEVYDSYDKAVKYAATNAVAYEGQILAVTENGDTTAYIITPKVQGTHSITEVDPKTEEEVTTEYNVCIKPIGVIPTGDGKTISVTEDGKISLLAADVQVDEKNEDGEATGNKVINAGAQLILQSDGTIKWVQPDTSTAEGQAAAISALKDRVGIIEPIVVKPIEGAEPNPEQNLWDALDAEAKAREDADKALGERIDGVNTALADYAKTADMEAELAKKADKSAYDQTVIDLDALEAKVDAFLTGTGASDALDSLQELIAYIDEHDGADLTEMIATIQSIQNKLTLGTYVDGEETKEYATVKAYVEAAIAALKIEDYAKAADLTELAGKVTTLEGKVDVDKVSEAIAAAKSGAEAIAQGYANTAEQNAKNYADTELAKKADADKFVSNDTFNSFKEENTGVINGVAGRVETVESKLKNIEDNAEVNAIEVVKVEGTALTIDEDRTVNITREKLNVYSKGETDSAVKVAKDAADAAQTTANTATTAASNAQGTANDALALAQANGVDLQAVENEVFGYDVIEDETTTHKPGLVQKVADHAGRVGVLEGQVQGEKGLIAGLNDTNSRVGTLEEIVGHDKKVEGETTIEATGLVKEIATIKERLTAEENKVDNDTTYTFDKGATVGTFAVTPKNGTTQVIDTGAKDYIDEINRNFQSEIVRVDNQYIALEPRVTAVEGDVSTLKEQIGGLSGAMHFKGVVNEDPTSSSFNKEGYEIGDVVIFGNKEYVYAEVEEAVDVEGTINYFKVQKFVEFGDATGNASAITALEGEVTKLDGRATKLEAKVDLNEGETVTDKIGDALDEAKEYTDKLAEKAIQTIGAGTGLKATVDATDATKVTIDIDEAVTFIFNGGSALGHTTVTENN